MTTYIHTSLLTREEECDLSRRAQEGDVEARDRMVSANLPLVRHIARCYLNPMHNFTIDDLCQEGTIGLMQAIMKFDARKNTKFSTYASYWIKQSIRIAIFLNFGPIKVPVWTRRYLKAYREARQFLFEKNGYEPTSSEIGAAIGLRKKQAASMQLADVVLSTPQLSCDDENSHSFLHEQVADNYRTVVDEICDAEEIDLMRQKIESLDPRDATIIRGRYGIDKGHQSLAALGDRLGLTKERIRQIEHETLNALRTSLEKRAG